MNPTYHSSSPFSVDLNEDQHHQLLISPKPQSSSSSSSFSCPTFFNPTQDQGGLYYRELQQLPQQQEEADKYVSRGGLCDHPTLENESDCGLKLTIWKKEDRIENQTENSSVKWMPSKLRITRKMMNSDQTGTNLPSNSMEKFENKKQPSSPLETDNSSNNTIRVCSDCNTTKTPLWRSGPKGPKSLCNACGIRQRKARRAAAAAAANGDIILASETPSMKSKVQHKVKRSSNGYVGQYKKRCKLTSTPSGSRKKLCFEDFTISLRKKYSAFQQVFPQDEKEAAILLMALSYGLVRG